MDIKRSGSQPSAKGPAEYFTGTVRVDPLHVGHHLRKARKVFFFEKKKQKTFIHLREIRTN